MCGWGEELYDIVSHVWGWGEELYDIVSVPWVWVGGGTA